MCRRAVLVRRDGTDHAHAPHASFRRGCCAVNCTHGMAIYRGRSIRPGSLAAAPLHGCARRPSSLAGCGRVHRYRLTMIHLLGAFPPARAPLYCDSLIPLPYFSSRALAELFFLTRRWRCGGGRDAGPASDRQRDRLHDSCLWINQPEAESTPQRARLGRPGNTKPVACCLRDCSADSRRSSDGQLGSLSRLLA